MRFLIFLLLLSGISHLNGHVESGYCSTYNGKICKAHISSLVWFSSGDGSGGWVNEQITANLFEEMIAELPTICRIAAEVTKTTKNSHN